MADWDLIRNDFFGHKDFISNYVKNWFTIINWQIKKYSEKIDNYF